MQYRLPGPHSYFFQPWFSPSCKGSCCVHLIQPAPLSVQSTGLTLLPGPWLCSLLLRGPFLGARVLRRQGGWVAGSRGHVPRSLGLHHPWGRGAVRGGQIGISSAGAGAGDSLPRTSEPPVFPSPKGTPLGYLFVLLAMFVTRWMMPTWTASLSLQQ